MRSTVNPFHQPLFEPVDRETIECDLDLLVRAQMNHFGYVGCSQVGDWSAIAGPGRAFCVVSARLRSASAATAVRGSCGRKAGSCAGRGPGKELRVQGNSPGRCRAVAKAGWLPKRGRPSCLDGAVYPMIGAGSLGRADSASFWQPESKWPWRRHDSACASRPRAQSIRARSLWPWFGHHATIASRSLRAACAGWPAGPWLGGRHSLASACCPGRGVADCRRAAAGLV